ncbi:MAG: DUF5647 family protein [Thermodesulfobacteriota bacterium]
MGDYTSFVAMISTEFQRYLMENEELANKIAVNALVIFQIEGEDEFNKWHKETLLRNREAEQPVIYVFVKKWREHSSIEEVKLSEAAA